MFSSKGSDMDRDSKLKAAKEKLLRFQKKKASKVDHDIMDAFHIGSKDESYPETGSLAEPSHIDQSAGEAFGYSQVEVTLSPGNQNETQDEQEYTENEKYYYNLYLDAEARFQAAKEYHLSLQTEIDRLNIENSRQTGLIENLNEECLSLRDHVIPKTTALDHVEIEAEVQRRVGKHLELVEMEREERELMFADQEKRLYEWEAALNHERDLIAQDEKIICDENARLLNEDRAMGEKMHFDNEKMQFENQQLRFDAENHNGPPALLDNQNDRYEEILSQISILNLSVLADERFNTMVMRLAEVEQTNQELLKLLETSAVIQSTEFCRAIVELSK